MVFESFKLIFQKIFELIFKIKFSMLFLVVQNDYPLPSNVTVQ